MFLCVHLSIYLFFGVLITPKLMNTSLYFLWVGSVQRKKLLILGEDLHHIIDTKNHEFSKVLFLMFFNDFSFLLDISSKVMNKF